MVTSCQYQEEIDTLNQVARHRPRSSLVLGIQQENRQIRQLQLENKGGHLFSAVTEISPNSGGGVTCVLLHFLLMTELRTSLEEHQSALELIMTKYREQVFRLLMASKRDDPAIVNQLKEQHTTVSATHKYLPHLFACSVEPCVHYFYILSLQEMQAHIDKINEMASVMKKAIEVDEGRLCEDEERIKQLEVKANAFFFCYQHFSAFVFCLCLQRKSVFCLY